MLAFRFDTIDSTNEAAKRLVLEGALHGPAYVVAREQTAGRGRMNRTWISPSDAGIYLTVVETEVGPVYSDTSNITLAAGVACAETLRASTGLDVRLKPVNDLYVEGRKLGGILTEAIVEGGLCKALIIGAGVNTHRAERRLPPGAPQPTSMEECLPPAQFHALDLKRMEEDLASAIDRWFRIVRQGEWHEVQRAFEELRVQDAPVNGSF